VDGWQYEILREPHERELRGGGWVYSRSSWLEATWIDVVNA